MIIDIWDITANGTISRGAAESAVKSKPEMATGQIEKICTRWVMRSLIAGALLSVLLTPSALRAAEDEHHGSHRNHVALFLGAGVETKRDEPEHDKGLAVGLLYEYRFREKWGIEGVFETLGGETIREITVAVPVVFHPHKGWRLFAGPGYEFTEKKDKWLFRLGGGYEFHLSGNWTLAPELVADFIETGAIVWLGGVAIGYGF